VSAPRFSVVLPTWRRGPALRTTIDGVLAQEERSWELLVVDDASDDDTADVAAAFGDDRVRVLRRSERSGDPCAPRNDGLAAARGRYVAYLDHDDRWSPGHLAALGALLDAGADVAVTGAVWADEQPGTERRSGLLDVTWSPELQLVGPLFEPSRVGHRAGLVEQAGGWRPGPGLEDWDLWVRLSDRRWATTEARTATVVASAGSRRHALDPPSWVPVATVPGEAEAHAALAALRRGPERRRLGALHVAAMREWHHDELRAGRLVVPAGTPAERLDAALRATAPADPTAQLAARPEPGGGWSLGRALATTDPRHLERAADALHRRLAAKYGYVRRVARAVAGAGS
jgi:hypothetical protein